MVEHINVSVIFKSSNMSQEITHEEKRTLKKKFTEKLNKEIDLLLAEKLIELKELNWYSLRHGKNPVKVEVKQIIKIDEDIWKYNKLSNMYCALEADVYVLIGVE